MVYSRFLRQGDHFPYPMPVGIALHDEGELSLPPDELLHEIYVRSEILTAEFYSRRVQFAFRQVPLILSIMVMYSFVPMGMSSSGKS